MKVRFRLGVHFSIKQTISLKKPNENLES